MNYEVCRGMELARMSPENQIHLRILEKNRGRCFSPFEIQALFNLPPLKTVYLIPEVEAGQAAHVQRLANEFYSAGLYPKYKGLSCSDPDRVHEFDLALVGCLIDYVYSGSAKKKSFKDQIEEN